METLDIIAFVVFPIALSSFQLAVEQERTLLPDRIGLFRSEFALTVVFFGGLIPMIGSGVVIFLFSWKWLLVIFLISAIAYPIFGRFLMIRLWVKIVLRIAGLK